MAQTVVGFFDNSTQAQQAMQVLFSNGFNREDVDITNNTTSGTSTSGSGLDSTSGIDLDRGSDQSSTGVGRFFKSLFGDSDEADRYATVGQRSGSIITVHAQSSEQAERAADLLDENGAINVDERAAQYGYASNRNTTDTSVSSRQGVSNDNERSIPKIEEELQVGKRTVETGRVRVQSRIVERPVEESIRLREEHVSVERNTVNRVATDADLRNFQETNIELVEKAEVPVVNKEARVVEEIRISKDVNDRDETIRDTVRSTEIDIENTGSKNVDRSSNLDIDADDLTTNRNTRTDL